MVWAAVAKGVMGASSGAKMAKNIFKRKGGKNASYIPASEQTVDVKAETVQPVTPLLPSSTFNAKNISKPTPSIGSEDLAGTAFRIKTTLVDVDTLLKGSIALDKIREQQRRKSTKTKGRRKQESELESATKKNVKKFKLGKLVPQKAKSIFGSIINFFITLLLGKIAMNLLDKPGFLGGIVKTIAGVANFLVEWLGKLFNVFVTVIDFGYKMYDGLRGTVGKLFGDEGLKQFDNLMKGFNLFLNGVIGAILLAASSNMLGGGLGFGKGGIFRRGLGKTLPRFLIRNFQGLGGRTLARGLLSKGASTTLATGTGTALTTGTGTALATGTGTATATTTAATGTTGATATALGSNPAGWILSAGLLASGLGEGAFQLKKNSQKREESSYKKFEEKSWLNPMKYFWGAVHLGDKFNSFITGTVGVLLDLVGAPFRYAIELIRYPFLDEAGREEQNKNMAKFDARIREQFREIINAFSLGMLAKEKGSFGSLFGKKGTDAMGYTQDGKSRSDLLLEEEIKNTPFVKPEDRQKTETPETKKPKGLRRGVAGVADFMTLGMFDFDQQNRKGAPKDYGIRRIAGGVADWATMGLTDFDKRGRGNLQVNPIGGGKDKAWGSANEQAKRREKQSGFGLKRGIGGPLDFATLGMFDFDKQNRRGAPKGFGIKRIVGGLADVMTAGATDFDKRGTGIGQMKLGEMMSNKKRQEAFANSERVMDLRKKRNELRNMAQFGTKDGRTISMFDMLTSGDRSQIEEALYMQRVKERGVGEGHSDWVGNPEHEAETLKYLQASPDPSKYNGLDNFATYEDDGDMEPHIVINQRQNNTSSNQMESETSGVAPLVVATSGGESPYKALAKR